MSLTKLLPDAVQQEAPWDDDKLDRSKLAQRLTLLLHSIRQSFVISLDSPYGTGKSFFLHRWKAELIRDGYFCVTFDAWRSDFSDDPLFAFIAAIKTQLQEISAQRDLDLPAKGLWKMATRAAGVLMRRGVPLVASALVKKTLGQEETQALLEEFGTSDADIASAVGQLAADRLQAQEASEASIEGFRELLSELVADITKSEQDEGKKKLVILVDELDRCRPDYALKLLECIKHLFSVEGVVFVLAVDGQQLKSSVGAVYGTGIDEEGYLRRFIDWKLRLPVPDYRAFAELLANRFGLANIEVVSGRTYATLDSLIDGFAATASALTLSLREQEQAFTEINLALRILPASQCPFTEVVGMVAALRCRMDDTVRKVLLGGRTRVDGFLEQLDALLQAADWTRFYGTWSDVRPVVYAWLMSGDDRQYWWGRASELANRLNSLPNDTEHQDEHRRLSNQHSCLSAALQHRDAITSQFRLLHRSVFELVYRRLEIAAGLAA